LIDSIAQPVFVHVLVCMLLSTYCILPSSEICAVSKYSKKEIGRCFKLIHKAMKSEMAVVDSKDFMVCHVQYFSYKLHLLHPYL
jgi:transcription initiation factor TFIIIB Brf1 subunit/transcription initiation factor TFIIB